MQGKGHDLLGSDLRAGPVREPEHRRDQGADGLHGRVPDDDREGTFIINGTERVVVSQLVRSPGDLRAERFRLRNLAKYQLVKGTIHPYRGEWMEFDIEQKPGKDVTAGTRAPASAA